MARSRMGGRKGRGYYKFTAKRKAALKKAQFVSAKNRKGKGLTKGGKIAIGVGVLAGAAAIGYVGARNYDKIGGRSKGDWRKTADPDVKERTRSGNSVSVAHPSQTTSVTPDTVQAPRMSTPITDSDRAKAAAHRQNEQAKEAKRVKSVLGSEVENIDAYEKEAARRSSENQIDRQVKGVLRATKRPGGTARITADNKVKTPLQLVEEGLPKAVRGRRSGSLRGTPGGTQTPQKAVPKKGVHPNIFNDEERKAHFDFIDTPQYQVQEDTLGTKVASKAKVPGEKKAKKAKKPKAPTAGTNTTADSAPKIIKMSDMPDPTTHIDWKTANEAYNKQEAQRIAKEQAASNSVFGSYEDPDW